LTLAAETERSAALASTTEELTQRLSTVELQLQSVEQISSMAAEVASLRAARSDAEKALADSKRASSALRSSLESKEAERVILLDQMHDVEKKLMNEVAKGAALEERVVAAQSTICELEQLSAAREQTLLVSEEERRSLQ